MVFDILQAAFWSTTYILIIISHLKYHSLAIPILAVSSNFAWETVALLSQAAFNYATVIHIVWFVLDVLICISFFKRCKNDKRKPVGAFFVLYALEFAILQRLFNIHDGMLVSCFTIDIIMALLYLKFVTDRKMSNSFVSVLICLTKLSGDFCAWIAYFENTAVLYIGMAVLLLNLISTAWQTAFLIKNKKIIM